jgi:hypothetical protein
VAQCGANETKMGENGWVLAELHRSFVQKWQWLGDSVAVAVAVWLWQWQLDSAVRMRQK